MSKPSGSGFNLDDLSKRERLSLGAHLYGGTPASGLAKGIAGLLGPSDFTAAFAGDAFMPAALGPEGTDPLSIGTRLGGKLRDPKLADNLFTGLAAYGQAQQAQQAEMQRRFASMGSGYRFQSGPIKDTFVNPEMMVDIPGLGPVFSDDARYKEYLRRRNGGMG